MNATEIGFVKRAQEYGMTKAAAFDLLHLVKIGGAPISGKAGDPMVNGPMQGPPAPMPSPGQMPNRPIAGTPLAPQQHMPIPGQMPGRPIAGAPMAPQQRMPAPGHMMANNPMQGPGAPMQMPPPQLSGAVSPQFKQSRMTGTPGQQVFKPNGPILAQ